MGFKPLFSAASCPISDGNVINSMSFLIDLSSFNACKVRKLDSNTPPFFNASSTVTEPSLPFKPTLPPTPAIGLIIKPSFLTMIYLVKKILP